jgi:hypothetical protein
MPIITMHQLPEQERPLIARMIEEAILSGEGIPWDSFEHEGVWKSGLCDFVPMLTTNGYYPQDLRNGFDDHPLRTMDCPEFAQQVKLALDVFSTCIKEPGESQNLSGSCWTIAEEITCVTERSMSTGAVVLAALTAGFQLSTCGRNVDDLFVVGISLGSLYGKINNLKSEVSHA